MFHVFGEVLQRFNTACEKVTTVDNFVAKLHYRFTFWILLAFSSLVCSRQYFGFHIQCMTDNGPSPSSVQSFCYFTSTYTVENELTAAANGSSPMAAHPGVGPQMPHQKKIYHTYYQWVPFVLFAQALLFYVPHAIWKQYEGGTVTLLVRGLQRLYLRSPDTRDRQFGDMFVISDQTMVMTTEQLCKQFDNISRHRLNRFWAAMMVTQELLNLVNVLMQLHLLDSFLGGNFLSLGPRIWAANQADNPFDKVFPKVTKCDFRKYGPSGSIQVHDIMCVLALNIINEKIYTILWFWFALLVPLSVLALVWRLVSYVLYNRSEQFNRYVLKETVGVKLYPALVSIFTRCTSYSDWLLLSYLSSNMDAPVFVAFLHNLNLCQMRWSRVPTNAAAHLGWQNLRIEPGLEDGDGGSSSSCDLPQSSFALDLKHERESDVSTSSV